MTKIIALISFMLLVDVSPAIALDRFITKLKLPSGQTAVISEGEFEARSIGSFSVRLYQAAPAGDETTYYTHGVISPRDGAVDKVVLSDINGDKKPEIIVVVRSAGTGGYISAYVYMIANDQKLVLISTVEGLQPEVNPILALKALNFE